MADFTKSAMKDFEANLASCTEVAACKRQYVRVTKWTAWLKSKVDDVNSRGVNFKTTQVSRLLEAAYRILDNYKQPTLPINKDQLCHSSGGCLLVFSILLELGHGSLIHALYRLDSVDKHLPISLNELKRVFSKLDVADPEGVAAKFDKLQWKYCPAKLDFYGTRQYPENRIMPFCRRSPINLKGGTAQLWQIAVLEEFVDERLREVVKDSKFELEDGLGPGYEFALKAFEDGNKRLFINERAAFLALDKQSAMVKYLCEYSHEETEMPSPGSPTTTASHSKGRVRPTHNIILEYGESDLEEYFADTVPPYLQAELDAFWRGLFVVADAVKSIHNLTVDTDGREEQFSGWHADIKPDNILLVHGKFKLADPGFMKVVKKTDNEPAEVLSGGTETYGAPERHAGWTDTPSKVHQTIDTWSLGCVFSIAATWVVLGFQGIRQYSKIREQAIKRLAAHQDSVSSSHGQSSTTTHGDHFHDGNQVLSAVLDWHTVLRNALRATDNITSRVLDMVEQKMLVGDAKSRIKADQTCKELDQILKDAEREPRIRVPENIKELLREVDDAGTSPSKTVKTYGSNQTVVSALLPLPTIAQTRKSKFFDPPLLKTTHRSQVLGPAPTTEGGTKGHPSQAMPGSSNPYPPMPVLPSQDVLMDPGNSSLIPMVETPTTLEPDSILSDAGYAVDDTQHVPRAYPRRPLHGQPSMSVSRPRLKLVPRRSAVRGRQDVFQVRDEIEMRDLTGRRWRTKKDELLAKYFDHRDIKFLIDNAETMKPFWGLATYVLETLLMKARGQDENGMDLYFTSGNVKVENCELKSKLLSLSHSNPFGAAMKNTGARPMDHWHTDITKSLGVIFDQYLIDASHALNSPNKKQKGQQGPRHLTLIVLTDGIWAGTKSLVEVKSLIVDFVVKFQNLMGRSLLDRQVSIEFVQFGDDPDASHRLGILDNDLVFHGIPDIVDTEHSLGDAVKMLLGSFIDHFDEKEDDDEDNNIGRSSQSQQSFDTLVTASGRDSTLYRPESSASQATQRTSIHSPASPTLNRIGTGTTERHSLSSPPLPLRHPSSPRSPPYQQDQ